MSTHSLSIEQLRSQFKGHVIGPTDEAYDSARRVFPGGFDRKPAVIIRPVDSKEVADVVKLARATNLPFSVKGGGHSGVGFGVIDGGIVLDLENLKAFEFDNETQTVWAQTGLTAAEYTTRAYEHGVATGFGDTGTVGIGGITLGGGIGYFVRKYGLTIDDLVAAEIVTADGSILTIDETAYPDLFWAIRGGGGNFGVVTTCKFRVHPIGQILGGMMVLPATPETIVSCISFAEQSPESFNAIFNVMTAPPMPFLSKELIGTPIIMVLLAYIGDIEEGKKTLEMFKKIGTPLADMVRVMPYPDMYQPAQAEYHPLAAGRTMFLDTINLQNAQKILEAITSCTASMSVCQLRVLGGAMARVDSNATAFAHRQSKILANLAAVYHTAEEKHTHEAWVSAFAVSLRQTDMGAYVNFLADEGETGIKAAYPHPTFERLQKIKTDYDPTNLFKSNQNIVPKGIR